VNDELERMRSEASVAGICLEGLRKPAKEFSQDSQSAGRDMKPGPPEYIFSIKIGQIPCNV
jgi:hypothetical protein